MHLPSSTLAPLRSVSPAFDMSTLQLDSNNNGAATIIMDAISEVVVGSAGDHPDVVGAWKQLRLTRLLFLAGFLTLVMDLATALYKPPGGVVFQRHRLAYYLTLAGIFAAGVAEVFAAFWLSRYGQARGRPFARAVLCASVVPLVVVTALGGFSVLMKC